jgi:hypothetical protein
MADPQQIQGLPAGAVVRPIQGLPPGAVVRPLPSDTALHSGYDTGDRVNSGQSLFDKAATPEAYGTRPGIGGAIHTTLNNLGAGAVGLATPLVHPIKTARSIAGLALAPTGIPNPLTDEVQSGIAKSVMRTPGETGGQLEDSTPGGSEGRQLRRLRKQR